ncbi:UTRA domain-containing protein [Bacillus mangrovi]|uniref:UTRA domain-containing protein n=1 Tax=Metabacillus mangrovi TaxID=1491830 RepID=A0A7X2S4G9_9BACI|nr:GntR family transcriptional regulator [Metabacillus mangrovi]MTH53514.1 UTRA domain-containing protein [Metabacillus mangrovi]
MADEMVLVDQIMLDIKNGVYRAEDKLPSENEMADRFRVPRMVVRKSYERLQELGYIYARQGKGSYVKDRRRQIPLLLSGDVSFSEKMRELNFDFQSRNIFCIRIGFDEKIYGALQAGIEEEIYKIGRLRIVEGLPIALHISYVKASSFPDIQQAGEKITSMFEYYRSKGYRAFESGGSILSVIFPTEFERELLECSSLVPLLQLESGCVDRESGQVLECSRILYRSDCFTYEI